MNSRNVIIGILFILGAAYCGFRLATMKFESYALSGLILFTLVGLMFLRRARAR